MMTLIFLVIFGVILIILFASTVRIVPQASEYVVERFGRYHKTLTTGVNFTIPFIDVVRRRVSTKEQVADFLPQPVITKDNVTMNIDTVVYFQITDAYSFQYKIENAFSAIENLTATSLRNVIGELTLDETLTSRDVINTKLRGVLDEATDPWGIKVNRVELKNILPPREVTDAMEKQSKAEREKRAKILQAEATKESAILEAEGMKTSAILKAEGEREAQVLAAKAQAEAIIRVNDAKAQAYEAIKKVNADETVIKLRGLEALEKVADGQATKIFLPSEFNKIGAVTTLFGELNEKTSAKNE